MNAEESKAYQKKYRKDNKPHLQKQQSKWHMKQKLIKNGLLPAEPVKVVPVKGECFNAYPLDNCNMIGWPLLVDKVRNGPFVCGVIRYGNQIHAADLEEHSWWVFHKDRFDFEILTGGVA